MNAYLFCGLRQLTSWCGYKLVSFITPAIQTRDPGLQEPVEFQIYDLQLGDISSKSFDLLIRICMSQ